MALEVEIRKKLKLFTLDVKFRAENETFALLGESGSGKSMTLKCIAGIERPDEGRIVLDGRVFFDSDAGICLPPQKRRAGYLFQDYALFPNMTVLRNVMAGMGRHPDRGTAERYLEAFGLSELADVFPGKLSGGQKQRTAMARLAAQKPDVILLDEPFSALDTHLRWRMENEMQEKLRSFGRPAVCVTHDRDEVFRLCSRVCCLEQGRSGEAVTVREFFRNPRSRAGALLSGCKNVAPCQAADAHTVTVPEWGVSLRVPGTVPPGVRYAGIRAHSFHAENGRERSGCVNCLQVREADVTEDLFEWTVSFRCAPGGGALIWKVSKEVMPDIRIPRELLLDGEEIMLLTS